MAKHLLKNIIAAGGLAIAIGAVSAGDARAFTETKVAPPATQPKQQMQPDTPKLQMRKPEDGNGVAFSAPSDAQSGGTEVKIPGVGSVGVLPKLDFGLELLYGNNNNPAPEQSLEEKDGDVQIKGTITHRF